MLAVSGLLRFISFPPFTESRLVGKQASPAAIKHRKKDAISPPGGIKAKSTGALWGCLGAEENCVMRLFASEAPH